MADLTRPRSTRGLPIVARIVGGVVVVGIVVGVGVFAERLTDDDLQLPDRVAGLDADDSKEGREFAQAIGDRFSEAYEGADAVTRRYGLDTDQPLLVAALRAESSPPVPAWFYDTQEWVEDGDVACLVIHERNGSDTVLCQRSHGDLTVRALVLGAEDPDVDEMVDATNEVWEDLS